MKGHTAPGNSEFACNLYVENFVGSMRMEGDKENVIMIYSQIRSLSFLHLFESVFFAFPSKKAVALLWFHWEELLWISISLKI